MRDSPHARTRVTDASKVAQTITYTKTKVTNGPVKGKTKTTVVGSN